MPIAVRDSTTTTQADGVSATLTLTVPNGAQEGDLLVATVAHALPGGSLTYPATASPAGWNVISTTTPGGLGQTDVCRLITLYRIADDEDASKTYDWTLDDDYAAVGVITAYYHSDGGTWAPYPRTSANSGTTGTDGTTIQPSFSLIADTDGMLLVSSAVAARSTGTSWTPPSGLTELVDAAQDTITLGVAWLEVDAGNHGQPQWTAAATFDTVATQGQVFLRFPPESVVVLADLDGYVQVTGSDYATLNTSTDTVVVSDTATTMLTRRSLSGGNYIVATAHARFDTEDAIPSGYQLAGARLVWPQSLGSGSPELVADWHDPGATIDAGAWSRLPVTDAIAPGHGLTPTTNHVMIFDLADVGANVNTSGYTGLRFHIVETDDPPSANVVIQNVPTMEATSTLSRLMLVLDLEEAVDTSIEVDLSIAWDVRAAVAADQDIAWAARQTVEADQDVAWSLRAQVEAEQDVAWSLAGRIEAAQALAWDVRVPVESGQALAWATRVPVEPVEQALAWAARAQVTAEQALAWSLRAQVTAEQALAWTLAGRIEVAQALAWATRVPVEADQALAWAARAQVAADQSLAWSVRETLTPAEQSIAWSLRQALASSQGIAWSVRETLTPSQVIAWSVRETLTPAEQAVAWSVRTLVTADQALAWLVIERLAVPQSLQWEVEVTPLPAIGSIVIAPFVLHVTVSHPALSLEIVVPEITASFSPSEP